MERIELSTLAILAVILFFLGWWFKGWARRLRQQVENGEAVEPTEETVLQAPPPVSLPTPAQEKENHCQDGQGAQFDSFHTSSSSVMASA